MYIPEGNTDWTASFWIGMLYLAYEYTSDEKYLDVIKVQLESFENRLKENIQLETHDIGFLYSLSCVAGYQVLDDKTARETAIKAADKLITRYHEKAKILQAWGDLSDPEQRGRMIIDCNINLPLLYFASRETGDRKYYDIAVNHAEQAAKYISGHTASRIFGKRRGILYSSSTKGPYSGIRGKVSISILIDIWILILIE
jgi:unsaturated chondroitin disaccharide hydrolase